MKSLRIQPARTIHVAAIVCIMLMLCAVPGCSSSPGDSASQSAQQQSSTQQNGKTPSQGERVASSLREYEQRLIDLDSQRSDDQIRMAPEQKAILQRAIDNGGEISVSDYEAAWSNYKQCMVDKGYTTPVLIKYSNGIMQEAGAYIDPASGKRDKFTEDDTDCKTIHVLDVDTVYGMQIGNPQLYSHPYPGTVDCLKQEGLADSKYTVKQLEQDIEKYRANDSSATVDLSNPVAAGCMAANRLVIGRVGDDEPTWYPLGQ
ncbi:hypothetical protein [Bifidobacterium biavatii]|uniref:Lipoprotein n=1 Tax=Bifidobacterium biavatii DSM 23969 TaxID=1437608 RepID=A0A087A2S1_9BIFI|nr:hypothetical protein [Bifidobacterium biavatii]KFI53071.1 hypothetical protein BBIA_1047 [Bifidobacterium biavatii DSM 23969]